MELESTQTSTTAKLPMLKQENGNSFKPVAETKTNDAGTSTKHIPGPVTNEEKAQKKNDVKERSMLLMELPNEHLMTFNQYKDAKTLFVAIETRFGGNEATKKTQKTFLKQLYENFSATSTESLDLIFNRLQKLVSQLAVLVWRNKSDLDTMSLDDLYKNFKIVEQKANQPNGSQLVHEYLEQIHEDDLEKVDLKWQLALLSMRAKRWGILQGNAECQGTRRITKNQETTRRTMNVEDTSSEAMVAIDEADYERGLASVEEQLVHYKTNASLLNKNIVVLKRDILIKDSEIAVLKKNNGAPIIEDWELEGEDEVEYPPGARCKYHQRIRMVNRTNHSRVNHFANIVPKALLTRTGLKPVSSVRPVNPKRANKGKAVKASACWVWRPIKLDSASIVLKKHTYIDARGKSKSEFDGGYITFGEGAKGGKITGKGTIRTGKLDFEDVYFVKELQCNLFSVSQMCDKKNSVLFNDTECFVLSPNYKLTDESHVLLKVPRKNNMYSVDMKNIVPKKDLTCLDNLVRGLPSKCFENNQTYVACLKRKQYKVSFKTKIQNSISQPLFMFHMDLFDPTSVFFLATKDETSRILKSFITKIENLEDKKVKIIKCDKGTKFKNRVMNEFCEEKGIKKEYSVAKTPQQNRVVERRNRTLIEAARTMLANFKLSITFWTEAVNTACYVQNKVLVVKPHFKTPYELFKGRTPTLSFMRPFGCHVTILNTLDHLGKFNGKSDEGFFVGNSTNSKAFRVYNTRTRKVQTLMILQEKGASFDAGQSSMETGPSQDYILMPLWNAGSLFDSSSKDSDGDNKDIDGSSTEREIDNQERPNAKNSTNDVNTIGPSINTASSNINTASLTVNTVRQSDDFSGVDNDMTILDRVEVDIGNISATYPVPTTPNTRIYKDYSLDNVIGDIQSGVQTRRMTIITYEQGFISAIYEEKTHKDLHTCLFACFLSQEEPKRITNALKDPAWVEAMQEELL
nr:hypothetical protein [Tanacetum cinerariifolium]